jgi:hypothetical protein
VTISNRNEMYVYRTFPPSLPPSLLLYLREQGLSQHMERFTGRGQEDGYGRAGSQRLIDLHL